MIRLVAGLNPAGPIDDTKDKILLYLFKTLLKNILYNEKSMCKKRKSSEILLKKQKSIKKIRWRFNMAEQNIDTQYKLFYKYWQNGFENKNIKDFQIADNIRKKIIPAIDALNDDENRFLISSAYGEFADFLYFYFLCSSQQGNKNSKILSEMEKMAEKAIELNPDNFDGYYFLTVFQSCNLKTATAGKNPVIYEGQGAADTILGTAVNVLFKGVTLGVTAAAASISNEHFNTSLQNLIEVYNRNLQKKPVDAVAYLENTEKVFRTADFCEGIKNNAWREFYKTVKTFDINQLDYSNVDEEHLDEAKEKAMEYYILADSKL